MITHKYTFPVRDNYNFQITHTFADYLHKFLDVQEPILASFIVILGLGLVTLPMYSLSVQMGQKFKNERMHEEVAPHFRSLPRPDIAEVSCPSHDACVPHTQVLHHGPRVFRQLFTFGLEVQFTSLVPQFYRKRVNTRGRDVITVKLGDQGCELDFKSEREELSKHYMKMCMMCVVCIADCFDCFQTGGDPS